MAVKVTVNSVQMFVCGITPIKDRSLGHSQHITPINARYCIKICKRTSRGRSINVTSHKLTFDSVTGEFATGWQKRWDNELKTLMARKVANLIRKWPQGCREAGDAMERYAVMLEGTMPKLVAAVEANP